MAKLKREAAVQQKQEKEGIPYQAWVPQGPPKKSKRGRKPKDADEYIKASEAKVEEWERQLKTFRETWTSKQYINLYNKKTAL